MSVENFDGDGYADQPSIIYAFDGGDEIRELSRSTQGELTDVALGGELQRPGDVVERDSTRSNPTERLPELELPGHRGLKRDDCGEAIPAFACEECGHPIYVGSTCNSPVCERDWPAAVKDKTVRLAGKLEGMRRMLYVRYDGNRNIDFNHVVASLPDFLVDSQEPFERALLVLKTLLEKQWGIDGFVAIYHSYRIKKEYRKDQYAHGGEEGEGDMTWKDVRTSENPEQYIKFEPHFHLFFPAIRASFDYMTAEAVENQTGWLFHRITKGEDSNVSVEDLEDLVHQVTYCFSHAGVNEWHADRAELTSRMKGELHNCYIPDGVEDECLALFCEAAPKLLGVRFSNVSEATCDAEISDGNEGEGVWQGDGDKGTVSTESVCDDSGTNHPLLDVWHQDETESKPVKTSVAVDFSEPDSWHGSMSIWDRDPWSSFSRRSLSGTTPASTTSSTIQSVSDGENDVEESKSSETPITDSRETCGGDLIPIHQAKELLDNEDWCQSAPHVSGLRVAVKEWQRRTDGEEDLPWIDNQTLADDLEQYPEVIQGD